MPVQSVPFIYDLHFKGEKVWHRVSLLAWGSTWHG